MPRLPSSANVPQVQQRSDPGLNLPCPAPIQAFETPLGQASEEFAPAVDDIIERRDRMAKAQERINARKRGVARDRADLIFSEEISTTERELKSGADLADESLIVAAREKLEARRQDLVRQYGPEDERLSLRLQARLNESVDRLSVLSVDAGRKQIDQSMERRIAGLAQSAAENPGSFTSALDQVDQELEFMGFSPGTPEFRARQAEAVETLAVTAASSLLQNGDPDAADDLLQSPDVRGFIKPSTLTDIRGRIVKARKAASEKESGRILSPPELNRMFPQMPPGSVVQVKEKGGRISDVSVRFKPDADVSAREEKARSFASMFVAQGMPQGEAEQLGRKLAEGTARVEINENTGKIVLIDEVKALSGDSSAVRELSIQTTEGTERTEVEPENTLFEMAGDATGLRSSLLNVAARIPMTTTSPQEQEVLTARTTFNTFQNDLARGLVINERFPVGEVERVLNSLDVSPSLFDNESAMQSRLIAVDRFMRQRLKQFERDARDPSLPESERSAQAANSSAMRNALDRIGAPQGGKVENLDTKAVERMGEAELRFLINQMSTEEIDALPDDVRIAIQLRVSGG